MSIDFSSCGVEELWRFVAAHLEHRDIPVVLVGGAVVSVYTEDLYQSGDLDFVKENLFVHQDVDAAMAEIGFEKAGRHYAHPRCEHLFVEFVSGPLGIGADTRIAPRTVKVDDVTLKILSPTDCVRDRLVGFIHFKSRDQMDQAVMVAKRHEIDWDAIEGWIQGEGPDAAEALEELRRRAGVD